MNRPSSNFRQIDVSRAIRAAQASGLTVVRVNINPDGEISVITAESKAEPEVNPWDSVQVPVPERKRKKPP